VLLHAAHWVEAEVRNGGFAQLFENPTGVLVPEGILGFQAIGMTETALLIHRASEGLGSPYPRGHEQRMARLREFEPEAFDAAEDDFFELLRTEDGGFEIAADKYAQLMQAA
jgi:hypothetical protein